MICHPVLRLPILAAVIVTGLSAGSAAQLLNSSQAIEVEADSTGADAIKGTLVFSNILIRQGSLRISAEAAESSTLGFDNSTWTFTGNVSIESPQALLRAETMTLRFSNQQIDTATLAGQPLRYTSRQRDNTSVSASTATVNINSREISIVTLTGQPIVLSKVDEKTGKTTAGQADSIRYDATNGNLELTGNAQLGEGGNQIRGSQIIYNIDNQTVRAAGGDDSSEKVHITIRPSETGKSGSTPANEPLATPSVPAIPPKPAPVPDEADSAIPDSQS